MSNLSPSIHGLMTGHVPPNHDLILASGSHIRKQMLLGAGLNIAVMASDVDETAIKQALYDQPIEKVATALALEKALMISRQIPDSLVLGADQMLEIDNMRLDKPIDQAHLKDQLLQLRGKTHRLISAAVLVQNGQHIASVLDDAKLTMRSFSSEFLQKYLEIVGDKALKSVGGYQLEGMGVQLFSSIQGDYFTILGLPLLKILDTLRQLNKMTS